MANPSFGLIAEGPTDHKVLENILIGHYKDFDLTIRPLQPLLDATDASQSTGGWTQVVAYCKSEVFLGAFEQNDYLIVQIDTDRLNEAPFNLDLRLSPQILVDGVCDKMNQILGASFGEDFLNNYGSKIIFAIAVDSLECWLLPLVFRDKTVAATNNCLHKLNTELRKKNQLAINPGAKNPKYYNTLSMPFCKNKTLLNAAAQNPSLGIFVSLLP